MATDPLIKTLAYFSWILLSATTQPLVATKPQTPVQEGLQKTYKALFKIPLRISKKKRYLIAKHYYTTGDLEPWMVEQLNCDLDRDGTLIEKFITKTWPRVKDQISRHLYKIGFTCILLILFIVYFFSVQPSKTNDNGNNIFRSSHNNLHRAIYSKDLKSVKKQAKKSNVNIPNENNKTALDIAISSSSLSLPIIEKLLELDAKVEEYHFKKIAPVAVAENYISILQMLYEKRGNMQYTSPENQDTLVHIAAQYNVVEALIFLITKAKVSPYVSNNKGFLPIHISARQNATQTLKLLISQTPNIDVLGGIQLQRSPLCVAAEFGATDAAVLLLKNKANININTDEGTPIDIAIASEQNDTLKTLIKYQKNLDKKNKNGDTHLIVAVMSQNEEAIEILVNEGADPKITNQQNQTPYTLAQAFNLEVAGLLKPT